jgi:DNA-binding NarL/FixJ family response regulator
VSRGPRDAKATTGADARNIELLGTASSAEQVLRDLARDRSDVVITVIEMLGMDGNRPGQQVRQRSPAFAILGR